MNTVVSPILIYESILLNISRMSDENMTFSLVSMIRSDNVTTFINGNITSCTEYYYIDSDEWTANTLTLCSIFLNAKLQITVGYDCLIYIYTLISHTST